MNADDFSAKMNAVLDRLADLHRRLGPNSDPTAVSASEAVEELSVAFEELQVADEEVRRKGDELAVSRQQYKELFDFCPDAYLVTDAHGHVRRMNRTAVDMFQVPASVLIGKPLATFIAPRHRREIYRVLNQLPTMGEVRDRDVDVQPRGAPVIAAALSARVQHGEKDAAPEFLWLIRDIGERRRERETLQETNAELDHAVAERTAELEAANARLGSLTRQIVSTQEAERMRVSRELHDESGQALTALKMNLESIRAEVPEDLAPLCARLDEVITLVGTTMDSLRQLAQDLRPPAIDAARAEDVLEGLCRESARRMHLSVTWSGDSLPELPSSTVITLYRFVQEALTNVAKHSRATSVQVTCTPDAEQIVLSVVDNGIGFEPNLVYTGPGKPQGIGLVGMQERLKTVGGHLEIHSQPGQGTRLVAHVPLEEAE